MAFKTTKGVNKQFRRDERVTKKKDELMRQHDWVKKLIAEKEAEHQQNMEQLYNNTVLQF